MRNLIIISWFALLSAGIGFIFWHSEWKYSLPTPKPSGLKEVGIGGNIDIGSILPDNESGPVFLHFYNPDCPCSRFNLPHFREIVLTHGRNVRFAVVLMTEKKYTDDEVKKKLQLDIPILRDTSIAATCGVYSTPQAVILSADEKIYYRGNYNKSRYCSDESTSYAKIALNQLRHNQTQRIYDKYALTAYGCQLPNCTK
ncbi:MAG: AhpC/TSA family protein [Gemmatimonadaceae bacterium]|nr:AhpC/TSA family protein [Chitinophagaceae bacterium]